MNTEYFSVKATRKFEKPERDSMFTKEQLEEKWKEAQKCAHCPYPDDCHVCPYDIIEENPKVVEKFKVLHENGATDSSIGYKLRMAKETVAALRVVLGLKENKMEDPCLKCRSKDICRRFLGTCNARARWERYIGL